MKVRHNAQTREEFDDASRSRGQKWTTRRSWKGWMRVEEASGRRDCEREKEKLKRRKGKRSREDPTALC